MGKIETFFSRWGYCIFLCVVAVALMFALGCTIHTSIVNPFVGVLGLAGVICALGTVGYAIVKEIKGYDN